MARSFTSSFKSELTEQEVQPIYLVELDFENETERFTTHIQDIGFDSDDDNIGETFKGVGELGSISSVTQDKKIQANGVDLSLSGVPSERISDILGVNYQYRDAKIWLGFLNSNKKLINNPYLIFDGYMDVITMKEGGESTSVTVRCESRLIELNRKNIKRYTNRDQKDEFPQDVGLEYVADLQDKRIVWGKGTIGPKEEPSNLEVVTDTARKGQELFEPVTEPIEEGFEEIGDTVSDIF